MPLKLDANGYNADFNAFVKFASDRFATNRKAVARFEGAAAQLAGGRAIVAADPNVDKVGVFNRKGDQRDLNNAVRTSFRNAISDMFGGENKIPSSVRHAMLMADYDKGKPLTARRIMAVKMAIDADGTAKARAARESVVENHRNAPPNSDEAHLAKFTGRFTSSEEEFAKGLVLYGQMRKTMEDFPGAQKDRIALNLIKAGETDETMYETMYRMALEEVEGDGNADLNKGGALFTPANNSTIRLALHEYTDVGFKSVMSLPTDKRVALARILDRFMEACKGSIRPGDRPVVQDDFVRRLVANIDELARLDRAGKLTAKALVKVCYPEAGRPGDFNLGNAIYADVKNLEFHKEFKAQLLTGGYYGFSEGDYVVDDRSYTEILDAAAEDLQKILGEEFIPKKYNLNDLFFKPDFVKEVDGLMQEAIAQNRKIDQADIDEVAYRHMLEYAVRNRIAKAIKEIAAAKGLNNVAAYNMAEKLLTREPGLYDAFRKAESPAEANAALSDMRKSMEDAVDRQIVLESLKGPAEDMAATLLANRLGITPDEAKEKVNFQDNLESKLTAIEYAIQKGIQPGCREPGFDPKPLYDEAARKVADAYIAKYDEIDALEGVDEDIKSAWKAGISSEWKPSEYDMAKIARFAAKLDVSQLTAKLQVPNATDDEKVAAMTRFCNDLHEAGLEVFTDWRSMGVDEMNTITIMALRPTMAKNPALKPILAGVFAQMDNIFVKAMPNIEKGRYAVSHLRQLALEP